VFESEITTFSYRLLHHTYAVIFIKHLLNLNQRNTSKLSWLFRIKVIGSLLKYESRLTAISTDMCKTIYSRQGFINMQNHKKTKFGAIYTGSYSSCHLIKKILLKLTSLIILFVMWLFSTHGTACVHWFLACHSLII